MCSRSASSPTALDRCCEPRRPDRRPASPQPPTGRQPRASRAGNAARRYAKQAFSATNNKRTQRGRVALRQDQCLQRFANRQARRLAHASDHSLPHQSLGPIMRRCRLSTAGENLAYGFPTGGPRPRLDALAGPPRQHPPRGYRQMAIAARRGGDGLWYVSQVFGRRL